jgi:capsular polysaccharide biosynthesis protein
MVRASSVNKTEFLSVTVNSTDPKEAKLIADAIADILPDKISSVVEGSKVSVVDRAVLSNRRVSPNVKKYVEVAVLLGLVLSSAAIILRDLFDDIIHDDDYLMQAYDAPVLGVIPDLISAGDAQAGYGEQTVRR